MKLIHTQPPPTFKPVHIEFVFETQDELDAMAALFNYGPVCQAARNASQSKSIDLIIREGLVESGANFSKYFSKIKYEIEKLVKP